MRVYHISLIHSSPHHSTHFRATPGQPVRAGGDRCTPAHLTYPARPPIFWAGGHEPAWRNADPGGHAAAARQVVRSTTGGDHPFILTITTHGVCAHASRPPRGVGGGFSPAQRVGVHSQGVGGPRPRPASPAWPGPGTCRLWAPLRGRVIRHHLGYSRCTHAPRGCTRIGALASRGASPSVTIIVEKKTPACARTHASALLLPPLCRLPHPTPWRGHVLPPLPHHSRNSRACHARLPRIL